MIEIEYHPSARIEGVQPPIIPIIAGLIDGNPGTISLGQGVVYYDPPPQVADGVSRFLSRPANHRYQSVEGIAELRELIAGKLESENSTGVDGRAIVVTAGSNMGFFNAILAICDAEDEVILLTPWYFNHEMAVRIAGCRPVGVATQPGFQPDLGAITSAITPRTRAVVTISPNNPTGAVYPQVTLDAINEFCRERGIYHIHDEAYEYFMHGDAEHYSPAARPESRDHTISLFSLSKGFSLASWRIGYMLIPESLLESVRKIQDTNVICPPVISQYAAIEAMRLGRAYCAPMVRRIAEVREHLYRSLGDIEGVIANEALGAFYAFLEFPRTSHTDLSLVESLVTDFGVAAIPGSAFGVEKGCYLRVSYGALEPETARQGIDRLCQGLRVLAVQ